MILVLLFIFLLKLLCRELGHSDVRYAGRLDLNSYNIPDSSWLWFSLITCDFVYGVDVQYLFQCRFTPWGYDDQSWCRSGIQAGMKCIANIPITTGITIYTDFHV